jgi:dihydrofolate reductase
MRKLVVQQWVTVDNIAAEEDGGLSFVSGEPFSETTNPAFKASVMGFIDSVDTMILGANTYAQAKDYWPYADDQGEYGQKLNNLTKFVASSKLDEAPWGDFPAATVTRDPAVTIRELKEQSGKDIWLWGSLKLMHSLLDAGVVDEVRMLVCPASRGKGTHVFEDSQDLKLSRPPGSKTAWPFCATRSRNRRKVRTFERIGRRPCCSLWASAGVPDARWCRQS